jgi:hypothetical protein
MTTASIVDGDVAAEIVLAASRFAVWDDDTARAAFERETGQYVPSSEQLASAIQAVFWASMGQEEGRPALTRVCLANVRDPACSLQYPRKVSPHELCKLSPVTDASENFLLVSRDGEVVSQDRAISIFTWLTEEKRIAVVRHIERAFAATKVWAL